MWTGLLVLPLLHTGYPRLQAGSGFLPASHAQGSLTSASVGYFCHRVDSSLVIHNRIKRGMKILLQLPSLLFPIDPDFWPGPCQGIALGSEGPGCGIYWKLPSGE